MRIHLIAALFLYSIGSFAEQRITISGFVREEKSREQLPGVNVYIGGTSYATATNSYGFYSLTVPASDSAVLSFSLVGYEKQDRKVGLQKNTELDVFLTSANQLEEVVVKANRDDNVSQRAQMSQIEVPVGQIKKIPALFGEKDVLKVLQLMPGVQKGTEGQTGLYVRGGGPDQNLIILDDAVVYNANHLFGFFSVFNSDAIKGVELTKGGFPARYGGRLSSVVEMNMKEGSKDKLHGQGGIGLISSRLTLEGPIKKEKSSFLVSGRRTYLDVIASPFIARQQRGNEDQVRPGYYFYDLNAKMNYGLGKKDKLYLSGYFGKDKLYVNEKSKTYEGKTRLDWGNATATVRWNHLLTQKLFVNTSLIFSDFDFGISDYFKDIGPDGSKSSEYSMQYHSRIRDLGIKTDLDFYPSSSHVVKFGLQATFHKSVPSALAITGTDIVTQDQRTNQSYKSLEGGIYLEDTWRVFDPLKINAGLRISIYQTKTGKYLRPEPRFSAAWRLAHDLSFKASYAQMNQYMHLLSNTGLGLPTDLWVPATGRIAPQRSEQFAAGFAKDIEKPALTITLEGYYKKMNHIISYKEGASFLDITGGNANELSWEDNVTSGKGWSYGGEFLIQRKTGRLSGWIGYTLSWTYWNFPELNFGKTFFPRYDRRHDLSLVGIYEINKKITLSANWVYGTGNALTLPVAKFNGVREYFFGQASSNDDHLLVTELTEYQERSNFRAEPYHRMDAAIQFHKKKKRHERTWEISIYNVYNRKNPFFYDMGKDMEHYGNASKYTLKKYSLFPILPSFSYNFKF
ncbi:TonB-dependent receptor [Dyadobacter sp. MSC1_007]|jgi:outer membrane receptor protein involved in Fe transport|uniref:TonB-dependent receptor n=1 Tax=Dyadobacter sp. MSC1_007 TaxID=2909264 RepID=UPI00202ED6B8|nr:TonB-dependent receptor [Dyadobacter sp. MSC1_007]